jgi:hypothetical protein
MIKFKLKIINDKVYIDSVKVNNDLEFLFHSTKTNFYIHYTDIFLSEFNVIAGTIYLGDLKDSFYYFDKKYIPIFLDTFVDYAKTKNKKFFQLKDNSYLIK